MSLLTNCSDEDFITIVKNSHSIVECERKLGYNSISGSVGTKIKERINSLSLDISHFSNEQKTNWQETTPFTLNSGAAQNVVRRYFRQRKDVKYICSICGQPPFWNNQQLSLIMDHINGNNQDHRLENLRWVCPNCNSQLETTGSRNYATYKKNYCTDCGKEITLKSNRCLSCSNKMKTISIDQMPVDKLTLKHLIRTQAFTTIGKQYNVSDNTIRKWCVKFNLPTSKREINKLSDEEWALL